MGNLQCGMTTNPFFKPWLPGWVLAFEIFIPLVLFFILLGLRQKKPAIPVKEAFYSAAPLTSAGIIPIMQSLCPDGQRDEFGFLQYKNSTVTQLLERISEVVEQNHLFTSDRPSLGEELESLQQHLESLSSAQGPLESHYDTSHGFTVGSVLRNQSMFQQFLIRNLSLTKDTASLLLSSPINLKEVYNLIFGMYPKVPSKVGEKDEGQHELHSPGEKLVQLEKQLLEGWRSLEGGLIQKALRDPTKAARRQALLKVLSQALGITGGGGGQKFDPQALREVEGILLTGSVLETLTCGEGGNSEMSKILLVPEKQEAVLQAYRTTVCGGRAEQRAELFKEMSEELRDQIDTQKVFDQLRLEQSNMSGLLDQSHLGALLKNLADVERLLRDVDLLSGLARLLPKGACAGHLPPPIANTTSWSSNTTTWGLNTTDSPVEEGGRAAGNEADAENPRSQFSAFVQLWAGLQPILCGNNRIIEPEALKQGNMSSLGFTSKEQRNLGLLVHLMTTNPKILYSPIGSEVDKVIQKANETFAFVGNVTHYARVWLNISAELRAFLEEGKLHNHLMWLQQFIADLKRHHDLLNVSDSELMNSLLEENFTLPNTTTLLEQLHTIDNAACGWTNFMSKVSVDIFRGFPDEESIVNYTLNQAYQDNVSVFASVIFQTNKDGSLPPHVMYKIRQNSSFTEKTNEIRRAYWRPGPNTGGKFYFLYGFVWIQDMIERAIINTFVGHDVVEPGNYVQMFPYPCYTRDDFLFVIEHMMPLCMVISWVYSVAMMIQHIVAEKEQRLKEVMKMMGLNNAVHWVAWFITGFVQLSISVTALTAILKYGKVLLHSDPFIIWLFLTIYAIATIMFCFLVSVLYSKAKLASACGGIIYFLSYVPYMYVAIREEVAHDKITAFEKCIASLMSTTAFGLGSKYFALYEVAGVGIQWRTINQSPVEGDDFNLLLSMVMLTIDAIVYGVLTWYIEAVHPGMYGLPRPWYFPLQKSYWLGSGRIETWERPWGGGTRLSVMEEDQACAMEHRRSEETRGIEEEPSHLPLVVCIDKLTKVYKTGSKLALNKLSLNLHENQVVSFLGHNGAGKTTTMSILTGLFPPTSGSATIYGHDIRTDMERIRQNLGMCPQHNVLFDKLSVEEHLWFYSRLKGMAEEDIRKEMDKMIEDLELSNKRHSLVQTLSGGMKRKLSVAIAFVGGSRAVILDEPTAGVDPYARRAIWDLILKYKQGRTILLSTHHMDEADLLGDRIAIISHGKLKCCGSPLFLKSTYGDGYKLTLVKKQSDSHTADQSSLSPASSISPCSESRVTQFIRQYVASCLLVSDSNTELSYVLPSEAVRKGCFERLFQALEQSLDSLALTSFGVMDTTLEEVFLKVSEEDLSLENSDADMKDSPGGASAGKPSNLLGGPQCEGAPAAAVIRPEMELNNLMMCSRLSPSQASLQSGSSLGSIRGDEGGLYSDFYGDYCPLFDNGQDPDSASLRDEESSPERTIQEGQGSFKLEGWWLKLRQFHGLIVKRFHCAKRNTKGIFSQILLPAFFVCVAMTVALSVPEIVNLCDKDSSTHLLLHLSPCCAPTEMATSPPTLPLSIREPVRCICSMQGTGFSCPSGVGGRPPLMKVVTGDILVDITGRNVSEYILYTSDRLRLHRYGGFTVGNIQKCVPASFGRKTSPMVRKIAVRRSSQVLYNNKGYHSMPTYLNVLNNAILRANLPSSKGNPAAYGITVTNHPMNRTSASLSLDYLLQGTDVVIAIFIIVAMSFVPASFVVFLVAEKSTKAKHLQFVSGCDPVTYWLANYIWDMLNYLVPATCCVLILFVFDLPAYTSPTNFPAVLSLFLLYGWSITPIMYPASFWFEVPSTAYVFLIVINLFIGITATVATFLLQLFERDKDLKLVNSYLKSCFLIFPVYKSRKMGRILAVDRLCLGVRPGECFGLLGVNGAGKTTTFKMLTGDESTTHKTLIHMLKRSVVLTSHSMEECEALCTRLGIMVNGRFKCLGSIQHLKNRFGDGYMITVRTKTTASIKEVIRFFNRNFPEAILKERHHTKIQYQLKSENISLAQVFSKMEQVVEVLSIEDYSVSQTTLDNVFVNFAKKQSDNLEQQESSPSSAGQSPLQRLLSILRPRPTNTELNALVSEEPEELESDDDDEGLISFEEERVQLSFNTDTLC
ncbi:ATP-binding cassette sub-family A member 2-like [Sinocyclocheilus grahami]|uniref:ATP-binding cassette sub-family A member 2-like n=1 Tax=Sinocyclocheilus grahami TaxID=75366 RepID=UPI0007AD21FF|nr:PREDICTED: ATP-binding cassette sub-family A member 2-like [Sinocyclocheilus grahami]